MDYPNITPYRGYEIRESDPATTSGNRFRGFKAGSNEPITSPNKDADDVKRLIDEYISVMKQYSTNN